MRVEEVMSKQVETIDGNETIEQAAKIMVKEHIGALIIIEKGKL